ncbi:hypothetical protein NP493_480g03019 [Ridgeia piscesae]|uniref:Rieske domain-containing protein n=1 Tax=Ridgeia piscesae TaxID=27915 RepID=A0AAD9IVV4_RIDPI|nr:hypothetical protein NP493_5165g00000 [Ridgeia piscesae]KAK2179614.1 hypothetical protein NP493_480g03019 [Ridgeia piscesae]
MAAAVGDWRLVGQEAALSSLTCRRLYARHGKSDDLVLVCVQGSFYAMEAWCSHMGGPLYQGDIEDFGDKLHVVCPWHGYTFDVRTGQNDLGIRQEVFQVKVEDSQVYVMYKCDLSTDPFS